MKITLRKGLNLKNTLVGQIAELGSKIKRYNLYETNSGNAGVAQRVDVNEMLVTYCKLKQDLIALKTAITNANAGSNGSGIYETLVKIEETKSFLSFLKTIETDDAAGENFDYKANATIIVNRKCHISYEQIEERIKRSEKLLETLLDAVEEFNGSTKIDVNI